VLFKLNGHVFFNIGRRGGFAIHHFFAKDEKSSRKKMVEIDLCGE